MLPKLCVNRHFPTDMVTVPYYLGGLNLPRYEWDQGMQHLSYFSTLYGTSDQLGKLFMVELEYCQLHVGSTECFLNTSYAKQHLLLYLTWLKIYYRNLSPLSTSPSRSKIFHQYHLNANLISPSWTAFHSFHIFLCRSYSTSTNTVSFSKFITFLIWQYLILTSFIRLISQVNVISAAAAN